MVELDGRERGCARGSPFEWSSFKLDQQTKSFPNGDKENVARSKMENVDLVS